ncbi:MAG: nucleotidyltransferase family protein [Candidatus Altiarchaeota archaeon]
MKSITQIRRILQKRKEGLHKEYGVSEIGVFGSFVRGQQNRRSDVDILVDFTKTPDLFELIRLENSLRRSLGRKVDLVRKGGIRPELRRNILSEAVII